MSVIATNVWKFDVFFVLLLNVHQMFQPQTRLLLLIILAPTMNLGKTKQSYCTFFTFHLITFSKCFLAVLSLALKPKQKTVCRQSEGQWVEKLLVASTTWEAQQSSQTSVHSMLMTIIARSLYLRTSVQSFCKLTDMKKATFCYKSWE